MSGSAQTASLPRLKNILFATDFSPASLAAVPFLRAIGSRYGSIVHLVHAVAPKSRAMESPDRLPELDAEMSRAQAAMDGLASGDALKGIAHTARVERGELWEVLDSVAEQQGVELIVLGTHGRHGLSKLVLGSAAEAVFRHASCPVLTVGPHVTPETASPQCTSRESASEGASAPILFATDFSACSQHALSYAVSLARANHSPLILLHAVAPALRALPGTMDTEVIDLEVTAELEAGAMELARERMAALVPPGASRELNPELVIECGDASGMILAVAENRHAGLIVMGAHRASSWASSHASSHASSRLQAIATHFPWDIASSVIRHARCPVLTVCS